MNRQLMAKALASMLLIAAALAGCARPGIETAASSGSASSGSASSGSAQTSPALEATDSNGMRTGVMPTTRVEPPSDADRPDGPSPTPDAELSVEDLRRLISNPATGPSTAGSCTSDEVLLSLSDPDAAAGHRYAQLTATNISDRTCELVGWPGLGLRGEWGTALPVVAEHSTVQVDRAGVPPADSTTAVTLATGGRAVAEFEWTGALAGTRDEHVSLIAVQLASDGAPAALPVDPADNVDIGPETTVRVGPWGPAS